MKNKKYKSIGIKLFLVAVIWLTPRALFAFDIYISPAGTGNGSSQANPTTLVAALAAARSGDTIKVLDGIYTVSPMQLQAGVSIIGFSQDYTKVKFQPVASTSVPMLTLSSLAPGSEGNQSIKHIEFSGLNGSLKETKFLYVQNRNRVSVSHCYIHDFDLHEKQHYSIQVKSTQIPNTTYWKCYQPADGVSWDTGNTASFPSSDNCSNSEAGLPATTYYAWPKNPVADFVLSDCRMIKNSPMRIFNTLRIKLLNNYVDHRESDMRFLTSQGVGFTDAVMSRFEV